MASVPPLPVAGARAFGKTIAVLDLIAEAAKPPRFAELRAASGLPKGTLHRILAALVGARLARVDEASGAYRLGPRVFELSHRIWTQFDIRESAAAELRRLAELWGATASLAVPDGDGGVVVDMVRPPGAAPAPLDIGRRTPAHASALGKALRAFRPGAAAPETGALHSFTRRTRVRREDVARDWAIAAARGYATEDRELADSARAVAAPILDHKGEPIGAVGLYFAVDDGPRVDPHEAAHDAIDAARRIAGNAGGGPVLSIATPPKPATRPPRGLQAIAPSTDLLGEAPVWNAKTGALHWLDMFEPALSTFRPATGAVTRVKLDAFATCLVPDGRGALIAAAREGIVSIDPASGRVERVAELDLRPGYRPNDGKCDGAGRLWLGVMAANGAAGQGVLTRLGAGAPAARIEGGFGVTNGMDWSPDGRWFYFADSRARAIHRFAFDAGRGTMGPRETFVELGARPGTVDGLCVDASGHVWCAIWDGWRVERYAPDGRLSRTLALPVPRPTSCAFGGPGLETLFVTSARVRLSRARLAEAPLSGSLFAFEPGARGRPAHAFAP